MPSSSSEKEPVEIVVVEETHEIIETIESVPAKTELLLWQKILGGILVTANIAVRLYLALFMIIADCDETYNYWEPLNMIFRGFGKQTWEYSPAYALRSYVYLIPYYLVTFPFRDFDFLTLAQFPPYFYFYFIRIVALGGFTAFTEYKMWRSLQKNYSLHIANWYLFFSTFAPGMSHASIALLPSSFAMGWITWATAHALSAITFNNELSVIVMPTVYSTACYTISALVGWPFSLALAGPFAIFTAKFRSQTPPMMKIVIFSSFIIAAIFALILYVDSFFYNRTLLFVPINIILYNVFAADGEGPEIFGVEPFSYYPKNLFLNFNVVFVLGYLGIFANMMWSSQKLKSAPGVSLPLIIWSFVFSRQPHKEERFLYPIYPLICVSAAIFTSSLFQFTKKKLGLRFLTRLLLWGFMALYTLVSVLRILNLVENYSAPIVTARAIHADAVAFPHAGTKNVCVGREWYHFPTSFFLPDNYRLRFVQSGFDGLLPGDFAETGSFKGSASAYPAGMNTKNQFSPDKITAFENCDYYIDNSGPVDLETGEPHVLAHIEGGVSVDPAWELLSCQDIIRPDGANSGIGRILYVPEAARSVVPYDVERMEYCLLKRR